MIDKPGSWRRSSARPREPGGAPSAAGASLRDKAGSSLRDKVGEAGNWFAQGVNIGLMTE